MYKLYWAPHTGAIAPQVMLEEAGAKYERVPLDLDAGEHYGVGYTAINPAAQIPALALPNGTVVTESAAIVLLLGERHPTTQLVPQPADADRPAFLRWLLFMATSIYMTMARLNHPERFTIAERDLQPDPAGAADAIERQFDIAAGGIVGDPWFLPRGYSALDIYLTMLVDWHPQRQRLLSRQPALERLTAAVADRPVFARVMRQQDG